MRARKLVSQFAEQAIRSVQSAIRFASRACIGAERYDRIYFKLSRPKDYKAIKKPFDIVFYCHWRRQWPNVKLVVEEVIRRRQDLRLALVTLESREEFPDYLELKSHLTILSVPSTLWYLFDARIAYTIMPLSVGPRKWPPQAQLVHAFHSMNSLDGVYPEEDFVGFDYILCVGPHHFDSFRERASRHPALLGKTLIPAGYPRLDLLLASPSTRRRQASPSNKSTVVYAPTLRSPVNWHLVSLRDWGEEIVSALLAAGHRVIFRPHVVSRLDDDRPVVERICQLHANNPSFSLDVSSDYTESYSLADIMVTDLSGTGFSFSFAISKPCIFFAPNAEAEKGLHGLQFDARHRIGAVVRDTNELIGKTSELCKRDMTAEIERFRDETIFNVCNSAAYTVTCLEDILFGRRRPEWVRCGDKSRIEKIVAMSAAPSKRESDRLSRSPSDPRRVSV
jgi:hypothetical protein